MFAIIITEKGGNERREVFDRTEINVGRVQGNELMLPKGNVSKHHARLLSRDGRFIVTDLKSTNGTYVNGRRITQATIVREGDKIYVGDFILRLESPPQQGSSPPPLVVPAGAQSSPGSEDLESVGSSRGPSIRDMGQANRAPHLRGPDGAISHYALENDPDEHSWSSDLREDSVPAMAPPAPPPARMPGQRPPLPMARATQVMQPFTGNGARTNSLPD
ncbi:MAG: FHA domain-containing protein, partial [Polyangiaceae bacterium]|nr:FHA domain-containing protein [Polyangiaceae bacterium]